MAPLRAVPGPTFCGGRFHRPRRRVAGAVFHCLARDTRRRLLSDRAAGTVLAEFVGAVTDSAGRRRGRPSAECRNPFRSIIVRAVEVVYAIEEALRIIDDYQRPLRPFVDVPARAGSDMASARRRVACCITDTRSTRTGWFPRRPSFRRLRRTRRPSKPTYGRLVSDNLSLDDAALTTLCEKSIRSYDPCISCSTHFLTLTVQRT